MSGAASVSLSVPYFRFRPSLGRSGTDLLFGQLSRRTVRTVKTPWLQGQTCTALQAATLKGGGGPEGTGCLLSGSQ